MGCGADALEYPVFLFQINSTLCHKVPYLTARNTAAVSLSADLELNICWSDNWNMSFFEKTVQSHPVTLKGSSNEPTYIFSW